MSKLGIFFILISFVGYYFFNNYIKEQGYTKRQLKAIRIGFVFVLVLLALSIYGG